MKKRKVSWGILSTANIGVAKVIPAMQKGKYSSVDAVASRDISRAKKAAGKLKIPKAYGSYEELLKDPEIDAVYIPLPNHLHVEWTVKCLEAGKHVLIEKPLGMNSREVLQIKDAMSRYPDLKVMEAFMYRHHPQWEKIRNIIQKGGLGTIRNIHSAFSYHNVNPDDVRNKADIGGGGLLDIGCYCISFSRFIFNDEPKRVCALIEYDPEFKTDRLVSCIMEFQKDDFAEKATATFTVSTQQAFFQYAGIYGTKGRIEMDWPFTPPKEKSCRFIYRKGSAAKAIAFKACDQYTIQGDLFSKAILNNTDVPTPIEDGINNMKVIDKIFESGKNNCWVDVE